MTGKLGFSIVDILDIVVVACLTYWILRFIRGTRAISMLVGLCVAVFLYWFSAVAELYTLNWILSNVFGSLLLVIVVVFQNDIRRILTQVGRSPIFSAFVPTQGAEVIEELIRTSVSLANKKLGALIVIERDGNVMDYVESGVPIDAVVSKEIITSIFLPVSPIHDGAIIIQKGRIVKAGCFLPLTMNPKIGAEFGTRHRAALGLTEETDAFVIVISEEKGWISVALQGKLTQGLDGPGLRRLLLAHLRPHVSPLRRFWYQFRSPRHEVA